VSSAPLLPTVDEVSAPFWEGTLRGELRIQRCRDTRRLIFPPRLVSPWGAHRSPEWVTVAGTGRIWSFVVPHPPLLPPFTDIAPYNVVLVELTDDPRIRLVGNVVASAGAALDSVDPRGLAIGALVRAVFQSVCAEGVTVALPRWLLDPSG
jgi:uncharacterized OB-fold protein